MGYKEKCGRYYCREHSTDALCIDCANHKAEDDHIQMVYQDYLSNAEGLEKEARATITYKVAWLTSALVAAIIGFFVGPFGVSQILTIPESFLFMYRVYLLSLLVGPVRLIFEPYQLLIVLIVRASMRGNWHDTIGLIRDQRA